MGSGGRLSPPFRAQALALDASPQRARCSLALLCHFELRRHATKLKEPVDSRGLPAIVQPQADEKEEQRQRRRYDEI